MRWMVLGLGVGAVVAAAAACSRTAVVESGPAARSDEVTARGTVRRLGSEGAVRTVIQGDESVIALGDYESEIARVAGAEVWITGPVAESPYGRAIEVSDYRILSVDGEVPIVGVLGEDDGGFYLARTDGSTVRLDVGERLAGSLGSKVWVVLGPDNVTVARYGILRE